MRLKQWQPTKAGVYAVSAGLITMVLMYLLLKPLVSVEYVIMAKKYIPEGTRVSESMVEERKVTEGTATQNVLRSLREVVGKTVTVARMRGDIMSADCVSRKNADTPKSPNVSPDELLFFLPVVDLSMYKGILHAGTRINLVIVPSTASPIADKGVTLLTNVEVVRAIENRRPDATKTGQGVFIKVTQGECERLAQALEAGTVRIAIRGWASAQE